MSNRMWACINFVACGANAAMAGAYVVMGNAAWSAFSVALAIAAGALGWDRLRREPS